MATTLRSCLCNSFFFGSLQTALSLFWPIDMDMDEVIREDMAQAVQIWRKQNGKKISSVQFISITQSCPILCDHMTAAHPASLSITNSQSSLRLMSIESVMPSSHLILCGPFLLLPPIPPSIRVFASESTLRMRWPKYWSFSISIIPSKEIPGLISFRMDW